MERGGRERDGEQRQTLAGSRRPFVRAAASSGINPKWSLQACLCAIKRATSACEG